MKHLPVLASALVLAASLAASPAAGTHATPCTTPATVTPAGPGYAVTVAAGLALRHGYYLESNGIVDLQRGGHAITGAGEDCSDSPGEPDTLMYMADAGVTPAHAYWMGVVRIESVAGAAPTVWSVLLDCGPLAWDGAVATVECVPSTAPPAGFEWRCFALMAAAGAVGTGTVTGSIGCGGNVDASCTATAGTGTVRENLCTEMTGPVDSGAYPLTCRADVAGHATMTAWTAFCGNPDP